MDNAPDGAGRRKDARFLLVLWAGYALLRLGIARSHAVVGIDEALYFHYGDSWLRTGTYSGIQWPVTYPLVIASLSRLLGGRAAIDLVFALAGSLTVVPLFFAMRRLRGSRVARWAVITVALLPAASAVTAKSGTHSLYLPLLALGFLLHVRALDGARAWDLLGLGALLGLAYVTRTDGIVYAGLVCASFALAPLAATLRARGRAIALVALGALPLVLGNVAHVHHYTGKWQLSAIVSHVVKNPFYLKGLDDAQLRQMQEQFRQDEAGATESVLHHPGYFARKLAYNVRLMLRVLGDIHGLTLPVLLLAGCGIPRLMQGGGRAAFLLLGWATPPLAFLALNVEPRYFSPACFFLALLAGEGWVALGDALRERGLARFFAPAAATVALSLLVMTAMVAVSLRQVEEKNIAGKAEAARRLAGDALPGTFIFNPQVRFAVDAPRGAVKSAPATEERTAVAFIVDPSDEDRDEAPRLQEAGESGGALTMVAEDPSGLRLYRRASP